jgi:hypothetical protein
MDNCPKSWNSPIFNMEKEGPPDRRYQISEKKPLAVQGLRTFW